MLTAELLAHWGGAGFEAHVKAQQAEYGRRAAVLHAAAERHVGSLATWTRPSAGMFLWMKLEGLDDAGDALGRLRAARVVVVPGAYSHCSGSRARPCPCVRVSFAGASDAELEAGMERLGAALQALAAERGGAGGGAGDGSGDGPPPAG